MGGYGDNGGYWGLLDGKRGRIEEALEQNFRLICEWGVGWGKREISKFRGTDGIPRIVVKPFV